jgi:hypothetical protein
VAEARAAALEELVPLAMKSLLAHLGDGDPASWRAALRVLEHAFGRPAEIPEEEVETPGTLAEIQAMTPEERKQVRAQLLRQYPELAKLIPKAERGHVPGRDVRDPHPPAKASEHGTPMHVTAQDWVAHELQRNARQIVAATVKAAKEGDWRAGA